MKALEINFLNFRNLENTSIKLGEKINIFYGKNAQGKTSILEAIYFSSTGMSFRTKKVIELIKYKNLGTMTNILYEDNIAKSSIAVRLKNVQNSKKEFFFNKKKTQQTEIYGKLNIITYIPEDIAIVNGSPKYRRDFFDMEISQVDKIYLEDLKKYFTCLKIRNKFIKENNTKSEEYKIYEEQFIKSAAKVVKKRLEYVKNISILLNLIYRKLFDENQELSLLYINNLDVNNRSSIEEIEKKIEKNISLMREREKKMKFSLVGPHRDDYKFFLNSYDVKINSSQGEKKSIIFSLKLAEIDIVKKQKKENPVVLIDDITSYFDKDRRNAVLKYLIKNNVQVIISSTDKLDIDSKNFLLDKGRVFENENLLGS